MIDSRIIVNLNIHSKNVKIDIDIPVNITANDLIIGLNDAFNLGMNTNDLTRCYLKSENPIALLRGDKLISDYKLRNGSIINIT